MKTKAFSTQDVQGFLEGRKTMFREVVKLPKYFDGEVFLTHIIEFDGRVRKIKSHYQVGDIIGVKETFSIAECEKCRVGMPELGGECQCKTIYKADNVITPTKWHSPVTMPREAIRLFLEVTDVKVERLQDISEDDAIKEGILCVHPELPPALDRYKNYNLKGNYNARLDAISSFITMVGSKVWDANNWHFVYECERVEKPNNL